MAAYTGTLKYSYKGVNEVGPAYCEHVLAQALANPDTLSLTAPAGLEDWVPVSIAIFSPAAPRVPQTNWVLTSHNKTTGVTVLTANGAVAIGSSVHVVYAPSSV